MKWKTRDGRSFDICEMSDQHLTNTIRFLVSRVEVYRLRAALRMSKFAVGFSECAQDAAEAELNRWAEASDDEVLTKCIGQWRALKQEAKKRNLEVCELIGGANAENATLEAQAVLREEGEVRP